MLSVSLFIVVSVVLTFVCMYVQILCVGLCKFSDEKKFACNICPARFKDCSSCRRHVREHTTGKAHICTVCLMPFKRAAQLKNHLQQQHDTEATANSESMAPDSLVSTTATLDYPDLTSSSSVNPVYYNSSSVAVFDVSQQLQSCDVTAEEAECSISQGGNLAATCVGSQSTTVGEIDTGNQAGMVSAILQVCDNNDIGLTDKSITQSLDYLPNPCSTSESDLLFPQERISSLPLPLPSLADDSITDVMATSANSASFPMVHDSSLSALNRPVVADPTYLSWHVHFADVTCSATVPLADDCLQSVLSVWSSLVSDMTAMVTDTSMQQHYSSLLDIVHKLSAVVALHLQLLQPTGTTLCHE